MTKPIFSILPESSATSPAALPSRKERTIASRVKYERLWYKKNFLEKEGIEEILRQEHCLSLGKAWGLHTCKNLVDLGCGDGWISQLFASSTTHITAFDIAQNALSKISFPYVTHVLGSMPDTLFEDGTFQAVICTDLLTELDPRDYRLAISEMARILAPQGLLLFSCPIDWTTDQPVALLRQLLNTEFEWLAEVPSYHRLMKYLKKTFIKLPLWFPGRNRVLRYLKYNRSFFLFCDRLSRLWWAESGITHLIVCARKKTLPFL